MERTNCLICGSQETKEIFRNYQDKHFEKIENLRGRPSIVVMCKKCGLIYHNPRLDQKEISLIYSKLYRPQSPSSDYLKDKMASFKVRADWLESHLKDKIVTSKRRILDVGCAEGSSLYVFEKQGWEAFGVEPSKSFSEYGRKEWHLNILTGFFSENSFNELKFDVLSLIRVLEHIYDPIELLQVAKNKLTSKGTLFIEVPNLMQPRNNLKKHFFNSTTLYIFSISTLNYLLTKANLEIQDYAFINGGIRVLAKPAHFEQKCSFLRKDSPSQIKNIILRHRIRWFLAAELKPALKSFLKMPFTVKKIKIPKF